MERIKSISLWIFFGLLAYMPLHILVSTWFGSYFHLLEFAKVFKDVILVAGFLLILLTSLKEKWLKEFTKDKLVWLICGYALLTLVMAALKPTDSDAEVLGIVYNLRFLLYFLYAALLARHYKPDWLRSKAVRVVMIVGVLVLAFGAAQYLWLPNDALEKIGYSRENGVLPAFFIDDKPDLERAMSTLRDPNSFGSYVIIILSVAVSYLLVVRNKDLKNMLAGVMVLSLMCLWFSFSRGAWIGAVLAIVALLAVHYKNQKNIKIDKRIFIALALLLVISAGSLFVARDTYFVKNVILHADESTVLEDPNQLRLRFWEESIDAALDEPLGYGPGAAGLASIRNDVQGTVLNENYYLQVLYEVGVFGLIGFLAILFLVGKRLYSLAVNNRLALALFASFVGLLATNFLVHIWSNEAVAYTFWGLAGLFAFSNLGNSRRARANKH